MIIGTYANMNDTELYMANLTRVDLTNINLVNATKHGVKYGSY